MANYFNTMMSTGGRRRRREPNDVDKVSAILAALGALTGGVGKGLGAIQNAGLNQRREDRSQKRLELAMKGFERSGEQWQKKFEREGEQFEKRHGLSEDAAKRAAIEAAARKEKREIEKSAAEVFHKASMESGGFDNPKEMYAAVNKVIEEGVYDPRVLQEMPKLYIRGRDQQNINIGDTIEDAVTVPSTLEDTRDSRKATAQTKYKDASEEEIDAMLDAEEDQAYAIAGMKVNNAASTDKKLIEYIKAGDLPKAAKRYREILESKGVGGTTLETLMEGGVENISKTLVGSGVAGADEDPENARLASSLPKGFWNDYRNLTSLLLYDKEGKLRQEEFNKRIEGGLAYDLFKTLEGDPALYSKAMTELGDLSNLPFNSPLYARAGKTFPISERGHSMPQGAEYGPSKTTWTLGGSQQVPQLQFPEYPGTKMNDVIRSVGGQGKSIRTQVPMSGPPRPEETTVTAKRARPEDLLRMLLYQGYAKSKKGYPKSQADIKALLKVLKETKDDKLPIGARQFKEGSPDVLKALKNIYPGMSPSLGPRKGTWADVGEKTMTVGPAYNAQANKFWNALQAIEKIIGKESQGL